MRSVNGAPHDDGDSGDAPNEGHPPRMSASPMRAVIAGGAVMLLAAVVEFGCYSSA